MAEVPNPSYLKPNSKAYKEEKELEKKAKEVHKVTSGKTEIRKKPVGKKVAEAFLGEDVKEVRSYLVWDILIPALKDTAVELIKKGADAIFYGGTTKPDNVRRSGSSSRASYAGYYDRRNRPQRNFNRRAAHSFDDILFETRVDAEETLSALVDLTMDYGMASVADFYELAGVASNFTDNKYGWGALGDATVSRVRDGYVIELPRPEPIE